MKEPLSLFNIGKIVKRVLLQILIFLFFYGTSALASKTLSVGSKSFTESYVLAEIMSQYLEAHGYKVHRKLGLGGTLVAFKALENGEIDFYP